MSSYETFASYARANAKSDTLAYGDFTENAFAFRFCIFLTSVMRPWHAHRKSVYLSMPGIPKFA